MDQAGGCREKAAATGRDTSNKNKTAAGAEAADDACARGPARTCVPRTAYKRGTLSGTFLNRVTVVGGLCPELAFSLNKGFDSVSVDALAADSFALLCRAVTYFGSPGPDGAPRSGGNIVRAMRLDPCLGLLPRHLRELTERSLPSGACISRLFLEEARVNLTKGIKLQNAPGITRASSFDTVGRWQESGRDGTCRSASVRVEVDGAVRTGRLAACVSSGVPLRGCGEKLVVNHAFVQLYRPCDWRGTPLPKTALSWPGQFMAYGAIEGPAGLEPEMVLVPARAVKGRVQVVRRFKSFREDSGAVADDGALYDARLREVDDSWRNWTAERFSVEEARCDT
ncbi:unnamed protein product [Pedinophyceae sp. YPF-701]|nr:unnamed protein product [Pedinophyceae sp. YPF-701]